MFYQNEKQETTEIGGPDGVVVIMSDYRAIGPGFDSLRGLSWLKARLASRPLGVQYVSQTTDVQFLDGIRGDAVVGGEGERGTELPTPPGVLDCGCPTCFGDVLEETEKHYSNIIISYINMCVS
ncbi:hypothetical protein AAG570_005013 [Ranatra chinensis]|uniref:Uncharacterized protein n=1 Tax=Ranatra chinensis TaxID=642074 RepID=A0ABD0XZ90_9HEMI